MPRYQRSNPHAITVSKGCWETIEKLLDFAHVDEEMSFHSLCAALRGCVPKGEEFVVYFRNNGTAWDIYADTGLGGTETVERFTNWSADYPQKTSEVFELTIHNLEEPT